MSIVRPHLLLSTLSFKPSATLPHSFFNAPGRRGGWINLDAAEDREPFSSQKAVISQAILALRGAKNALLESPTGTGKTLALLTATLAWQRQLMKGYESAADAARRKRKRRPPKIFFASRTHGQIAQVIRELRTLPERYTSAGSGTGHDGISMAVLASRSHMCVNHSMRAKGKNVDESCKNLLSTQMGCSHKMRTRTLRGALPAIFDIEDITRLGAETHRSAVLPPGRRPRLPLEEVCCWHEC